MINRIVYVPILNIPFILLQFSDDNYDSSLSSVPFVSSFL